MVIIDLWDSDNKAKQWLGSVEMMILIAAFRRRTMMVADNATIMESEIALLYEELLQLL